MLICPSDFINLVLLGRRYTDKQVIELSAKNQFHHLLSLNIPGVRITKAGSYKRNLCTRQNKDNGSPDVLSVPRIRIRAGLAVHTHGLISDLCIPHSAYTITFVMTVLFLHFVRHRTIKELSDKWHVSPKTIRRWKKLYISHAAAWKTALKKFKENCDDAVSVIKSIPPFPYSFYCLLKVPFLNKSPSSLFLSGDPLRPP